VVGLGEAIEHEFDMVVVVGREPSEAVLRSSCPADARSSR